LGSKPRQIAYVPQVLQRFAEPKVLGGRRSAFIIKSLRDLIKSHTLTPHRQLMAVTLLMYCQGLINFINANEMRPQETVADDKGVRDPALIRDGVLDLSAEFETLLKIVNQETRPAAPAPEDEA
jgi:hypothetical protein